MSSTTEYDRDEVMSPFRWIGFVAPILPLFTALGYLSLVVDLRASEWVTLNVLFLAYTFAAGWHSTSNQKACVASISRLLASGGSRNEKEIDAEDLETASARAISLPAEVRRARIMTMSSLAILVPLAMVLLGFEGWFSPARIQTFSLVILAAALGGASLEYYMMRHAFQPIRSELSDYDLAGQASSEMPKRISIARVLQFSVTMPVLVGLMLTLNLISEQRRTAAEIDAIEWSEAALLGLFDTGPKEELLDRIADRNRAQASWPRPVVIALHSLDRVESGESSLHSTALASALDRALESNENEGVLEGPATPAVGVFRRLDANSVLVSTVDRTDFESSLVDTGWALGLLVAALVGLSFGFSQLVSRDMMKSIGGLRHAAERLARGEVASHYAFETGDELGELGQTVYRVGSDLRATTARVSDALDRVERAANDAMAVGGILATASAEQSARLRQAMDLVISIDARGCDISRSAEGLNTSVDESSSSIAELGAAGAELNETASVLSAKVDEVSNSMEHMVSSVKQVSATTEKLAGASEDTSSSMEEMASAMRVVDTSAETMAGLSLDVVAKAELGQAKVCQTIEGMEAIREATDAAERVIRGLGSRTLEIGGILDVIDDVADETNLLALNAAIIAAQAGEHGKAFSVVADEIKELADRVLASTKEIGGLIRSVQEESENAIGAIEAGSQSVMSGVDLSAEAGRTLEEITDASRQNGVRIGEIVSSVREQTKAAAHVVVLMERVRDSADEIATASGEQDRGNEVIYRSALTMREVAQQVRRTTEEQSLGFGRIRESVEGVRSTVEHITGSLREQASSCGEVSAFLSEVSDGICSNDEALEKMGGAMKELLAQAAALREDVERCDNS